MKARTSSRNFKSSLLKPRSMTRAPLKLLEDFDLRAAVENGAEFRPRSRHVRRRAMRSEVGFGLVLLHDDVGRGLLGSEDFVLQRAGLVLLHVRLQFEEDRLELRFLARLDLQGRDDADGHAFAPFSNAIAMSASRLERPLEHKRAAHAV